MVPTTAVCTQPCVCGNGPYYRRLYTAMCVCKWSLLPQFVHSHVCVCVNLHNATSLSYQAVSFVFSCDTNTVPSCDLAPMAAFLCGYALLNMVHTSNPAYRLFPLRHSGQLLLPNYFCTVMLSVYSDWK